MSFNDVLADLENESLTPKQLDYIYGLMEEKHITIGDLIDDGFPPLDRLNKNTGSELLEYLLSARKRDLYENRGFQFSHIADDLPVIDMQNDDTSDIPF